MRTNEHPTGKVRYRSEKRWMKPDVLVLQVQVTCGDGPSDSNGMPEYLSATYWRDAQVEDLDVVLRGAPRTPQPADVRADSPTT
jgi:hypothetical protein